MMKFKVSTSSVCALTKKDTLLQSWFVVKKQCTFLASRKLYSAQANVHTVEHGINLLPKFIEAATDKIGLYQNISYDQKDMIDSTVKPQKLIAQYAKMLVLTLGISKSVLRDVTCMHIKHV